jgi:hypothetical protein
MNENQFPAELQKIAEAVSVEKKAQVLEVLGNVFSGVKKMREQIDVLTVESPEDEKAMKIARSIRLAVRDIRLDNEKAFDAKRADVQSQMISFKAEDSLWLRSKQIMQILTKEVEDLAKYKEDTKKRYEEEQRQLLLQQRAFEVSKFDTEIPLHEFESMSESAFDLFLNGLKNAHLAKIEAEKEAERLRIEAEKEAERLRIEAEKEAERIKKENEALREKLRKEQEIAEKERIAQQKERERLAFEAEQERKKEQAKQAELQEKLNELARKEREQKERERLAFEQAEKDRIAQQKAASLAPDKEKLQVLINAINSIELPKLASIEAQKLVADVDVLLKKVTNFINEKSKSL